MSSVGLLLGTSSLALLVACEAASSPSSSADTTTATSAGSDVTSDNADPCSVFADCLTPQACGCFAPSTCGPEPPNAAFDNGWTIYGDGRCPLEMLRDAVPSQLAFAVSQEDDVSVSEYSDLIILLGDRTAAFTRTTNGLVEPVKYVQIRPPEFFDACLVDGTPEALAGCLSDWFAEELCGPIACCPASGDTGAPPACSG